MNTKKLALALTLMATGLWSTPLAAQEDGRSETKLEKREGENHTELGVRRTENGWSIQVKRTHEGGQQQVQVMLSGDDVTPEVEALLQDPGQDPELFLQRLAELGGPELQLHKGGADKTEGHRLRHRLKLKLDEVLPDMELELDELHLGLDELGDLPHELRERLHDAFRQARERGRGVFPWGGEEGEAEHEFEWHEGDPRYRTMFGRLRRGHERPEHDRVFLRNGDVVSGELLGVDSAAVKIQTSYGELALKRSEVARIVFKHPRAFLGISPQEVEGAGVGVEVVQEGSAAAKAGLQVNDVILEIGGHVVMEFDEVKEIIDHHNAGDTLSLKVQRGSETLELKVTLGGR